MQGYSFSFNHGEEMPSSEEPVRSAQKSNAKSNSMVEAAAASQAVVSKDEEMLEQSNAYPSSAVKVPNSEFAIGQHNSLRNRASNSPSALAYDGDGTHKESTPLQSQI